MMKMSVEGIIQLICLEGISFTVYRDSVGVKTIGVGLTASEIPDLAKWPKDKALSMSEVLTMLYKALTKYEQGIINSLHKTPSQTEFDALVSFTYNVGIYGAAHSTLVKYINAGQDDKHIEAAFMMWTKQKELIGRRQKEVDLYLDGKYTNNGMAMLIPSKGQVNVRKLLSAVNTPIGVEQPVTPSLLKKIKDFLTNPI